MTTIRMSIPGAEQYVARHPGGEYATGGTAFPGTYIKLYRFPLLAAEAAAEADLLSAAVLPTRRGLAARAELEKLGYAIDWEREDNLREYLNSVAAPARDDDGDN